MGHFFPGFTEYPEELQGFLVRTHLIKGARGFGFNIVGGSKPREFLQVYSVTSIGPSALKTGDCALSSHVIRYTGAELQGNALKDAR